MAGSQQEPNEQSAPPYSRGEPERSKWWHCHHCITTTAAGDTPEQQAINHAAASGHTTVHGEQWSQVIYPLRTQPEVTP